MIEFTLNERDYIELHNLLKATGLCDSGGIAKLVIADGLVKVDHHIEQRKRCKIRPGQTIEYSGHTIITR